MHGRPVAVPRLVRFHYPPNWVQEIDASAGRPTNISNIKVGDYVALESLRHHRNRIHLALVSMIHQDQDMLEVQLMHVPQDSRYGPWQRRPWVLWSTPEGHPRVEIVPLSEVLCKVTLCEGALDLPSLATLSNFGIDVGSTPHRDHTLPPRGR